jgi:hypothetical protein
MRCPKCVHDDLRSTVQIGHSWSTCMAGSQYYDEHGNFVSSDPNTVSTGYRCSNGHAWSESVGPGLNRRTEYLNFTIAASSGEPING